MWLIKTEHGYMLEDELGRMVKWFDMAANCKAYCMEQGVTPVYLSKKSVIERKEAYTRATGKVLWFDKE